MNIFVKAVKNPKKAIKVALGRIVDSFVTILPDQLFIKLQFADCMLVLIDYTIIALRKRFSDYETFGGLYHDLQVGLLELTLLERILPIISQILERILILCNTTPEELWSVPCTQRRQ